MVADVLEAEWNAKLRALEEAQRELDRSRAEPRQGLDDEQRRRILALASDFPRLWNDPATPQRERKRMARLLIEDVTLTKATRSLTKEPPEEQEACVETPFLRVVADRIGAPGSPAKNAIPRHRRRQLVLNHLDRREDGRHSKANCTSSGFEAHSTGWEGCIWGIPKEGVRQIPKRHRAWTLQRSRISDDNSTGLGQMPTRCV